MPTPPPGRELLAGKRVVVTAAAGTGIGSAVAERCLLEGAQVMISDIHERRLGETADRLAEATGVRPHTAICNVTVEDDVQALVAAAVEAMGGIDVMMLSQPDTPVLDIVEMILHAVRQSDGSH